jgi:hypothetical protein
MNSAWGNNGANLIKRKDEEGYSTMLKSQERVREIAEYSSQLSNTCGPATKGKSVHNPRGNIRGEVRVMRFKNRIPRRQYAQDCDPV